MDAAKHLASEARRTPTAPIALDSVEGLPEPVARHLARAGVDGRTPIAVARLEQAGRLCVRPGTERWSRFSATHVASCSPPGFVWDARVRVLPGVGLRVRDAYSAGVGGGAVSLGRWIPLGAESGLPPLNVGALYRFLAEAPWYPTALLPRPGLWWEPADDRRAVVHLVDEGIEVALEFRFDEAGDVAGIYTEDRPGKFGDAYVRHPWEGRFGGYREHGGLRIPTEAEVGWHLPEGWWLFWQGRVTSAAYEHVPASDRSPA